MLSLALLLSLQPALPTLDDVYGRVRKMQGAMISMEMVRPSVVAMEFQIARGGYLKAKYPTSEDYIDPKGRTSWFPDRREFAKSEREEDISPVPAGFEPLWPGAKLLEQEGEPTEATFQDQKAVAIPCKGDQRSFQLFVSPTTLLPIGTIASANGTTYEMHLKKVVDRYIDPKSLVFKAPKDAKPFVNRPLDEKLIKPGAKLPAFTVKDGKGRVWDQRKLLGKPLVMNFWFSACTGCVQEMPFLAKLEPQLKGTGISFIGVNPIDDKVTAERTAKTNKLPFSSVSGADAKKLADIAGIIAYPVTLVVDAQGKVVDSIMGFDEPRLLKALTAVGYRP